MDRLIQQTWRVLAVLVLMIVGISLGNWKTKTEIRFFREFDFANRIFLKPKIDNKTDSFPQYGKRGENQKVFFIVVHHEAVANSSGVYAVRNYHINKNGWTSIAYNYYIEKSGRIIHCLNDGNKNASEKRHNAESVSICLQGNFDTQQPGRRQYIQLLKLCKKLEKDFPSAQIFGHRTFADKTCPGKNINIDTLRKEVSELHFFNHLKPKK